MAKFNLGDTIPEFISLEKQNDADLTVVQLIKRGEATNDILGNPFETIYKKLKDEFIFEGTIQSYDRMMKYFEGGRFKLNIETWFKSDKCLERHNCIKMTANKYSGSTVTRTRIVIEVGISSELQSEIDTHHGYTSWLTPSK